jgi:hypothetical protein
MSIAWSGKDTVYRCGTNRLHKQGACPMPTLRRRETDEPLLATLVDQFIDLEATREELTRQSDADASAIEAELTQAQRGVREAENRLERVRRDYQDGNLPISDWSEQRDELTGEVAAATDRVAALEADLQRVKAIPSMTDGHEELVAVLDAVRAAVAARGGDRTDDQARASIQAVRVALGRIASHVRANLGADGSVTLEIGVRDELILAMVWAVDTADTSFVLEPSRWDRVPLPTSDLSTASSRSGATFRVRPCSMICATVAGCPAHFMFASTMPLPRPSRSSVATA